MSNYVTRKVEIVKKKIVAKKVMYFFCLDNIYRETSLFTS